MENEWAKKSKQEKYCEFEKETKRGRLEREWKRNGSLVNGWERKIEMKKKAGK